jgi:4-hydroxy-3-methylbut-2-enyl diphosphate reductase
MLRKYAADHEAIVFVAGKASSNGKVLYDVCREVNPNTYFIEDISEINPSWFKGISKIGITGATSTPQWYMNHVQEHLSNLVTV